VERADPDRFAAAMAAPLPARLRLFPVYAFNVEVTRAPWVTSEPMIAEMRLQWWRDALEEVAAGGPVRRHEVATPLASVVDAAGARLLDDLVAARRWDIYRDPFEDMAHFRGYIRRTSANLLGVGAGALGGAPEEVIHDAGMALGLANWLRAVPALERAGRVPLVEGTPEAVRALGREGLEHLARARAARGRIPAEARPAFLPLWLAGPVLKRAARSPGRVASGLLEPSPVRRRLGLMASAASGRW
jgi:phytoene/squalene synthetase